MTDKTKHKHSNFKSPIKSIKKCDIKENSTFNSIKIEVSHKDSK
jgi:hypothetical protein